MMSVSNKKKMKSFKQCKGKDNKSKITKKNQAPVIQETL